MSSARAVKFRELGEAWGGEEWQRPLARALVAAGLLSGDYADTTVRRYASEKREAPDDIMEWLSSRAGETVHWLVGKTDKGQKAIAHLTKPRFYAIIEKGALSRVEWIDKEPDRRVGGKLLAQAVERVA
ncbi:MAG TPA: hypothetical protein VGF56_05670 [Rhizomicrobium sp.]|jgi:hypothetical protein